MAIDKALNRAPLGLSSENMEAMLGEPDIEIEIEDPEEVSIKMGGVEIEIEPAKETDEDFNVNLAEHIDDSELASLVEELISDFDEDIASRKDWIQTYVDGLELLGLKIEERAEPWEGACGVFHPLLSEALVKFQAETIPLRTHAKFKPILDLLNMRSKYLCTPERNLSIDRPVFGWNTCTLSNDTIYTIKKPQIWH